ncbi:hypothetical protein K7X08_023962 [Anisodus acutangulus]|uniref:Retrotransposon gag domain-containing protein n=1 Tax=Anisodus acutangulus TaxID=402998 RepID=A0A9Q1RF77_9SOLA|nr:hypothetical protein K7X08_023962 [Anisodus acutangulus]
MSELSTNNMASEINDEVNNHEDNNSDNGAHNVNNNNDVPPDVPPVDSLNGIPPIVSPNDVLPVDSINNNNPAISPRSSRRSRQKTPDVEINLAQIFYMLKEKQKAITHLQKKSSGETETDEVRPVRNNESGREEDRVDENANGSGTNESSEVLKMLEALTKRIDTNKKNVETYNLRVDQISEAPPILKGNDMHPNEIESVLLKKFGEMLSNGAMTWYSILHEHSINSFEMFADSFIKAHAGARKVQARKTNIFKIDQKDTELLREFVTEFQKERMLLPRVPNEWTDEAFTKGLNPRSSGASLKLNENLLEFTSVTWADV